MDTCLYSEYYGDIHIMATYTWLATCLGWTMQSCTKISSEACSALDNIVSKIVFLCITCLQMPPVALKCFDSQSYVDSKVKSIGQSLSEIQNTENSSLKQ